MQCHECGLKLATAPEILGNESAFCSKCYRKLAVNAAKLSMDDLPKSGHSREHAANCKDNKPREDDYQQAVFTNILEEAHVITEGNRASDYGDATESFGRIAILASSITNKHFTARDICKILMAVKLVRESFKHKRDNLVDLCGYARLLQDIEDDLANMEPNCKPANS